MLIAPEREWLAAARIVAENMPVVTMCADFRAARPSLATVALDNRTGARLAMSHLLELGHRDIAFVAGPPTSPEATARQRSWRDEMRRAGLSAERVATPATGVRRAATPPGCQMIADGVPTAVFAANDQMALGVLSALAEAGLDVPGDVSVAGFDDVPDSAYFTPALTTVRQDFAALAARCVAVLERILRGGSATSVRIRPELVVRSSTDRAPMSARSGRPSVHLTIRAAGGRVPGPPPPRSRHGVLTNRRGG